MAEWNLTAVNVRVQEHGGGAIQPTVPTPIMLGVVPMYVTAQGWKRLTGRRHSRVTGMHAAYGKRRGQR